MTPRSLVGMTMGARKRRALSAQEDDALSRLIRDPLKVLCGHFDAHDNAEQYRKPYRIGQRLRPCPGCRKCGYEPTVTLWKLSRDAMWMSGSLVVRDIRNICDGSGVIPAKARKVRR